MCVQQRGMTLLEVLLAMGVLAVGLFAAASLQVQALRATEAALTDTRAALNAHAQQERARAGQP
ncbi:MULTISPECIES: prepilin-type N-terminal cleavage/methylation domain-containing protein [unclassified Pseudomonas]|nr:MULTISPECIES: prepilin-type N-terminal cleavage/methylation domain-containing protein [unclassified Pseudomonas]MCT8166928.1 prepilin-type N-terminal cleavage/methylation domain-containing protein [Pseudomonas sp. HD6422]MCT8185896.1 prepilin-type N-terminal cleavage/methylation domain-containing protein [Pseudomonas sp. HD6421]